MRLHRVPSPGEDARTLREALRGPPRLAERTRAMLAGDLTAPDLEPPTMPKEVPTSLRLPADVLERAERLVDRLRNATSGLRVNRSQVLVLALERGLDMLEQTYGTSAPSGRGGKR